MTDQLHTSQNFPRHIPLRHLQQLNHPPLHLQIHLLLMLPRHLLQQFQLKNLVLDQTIKVNSQIQSRFSTLIFKGTRD